MSRSDLTGFPRPVPIWRLIALRVYAPASNVRYYSTSSTYADIDAVNMAVSFRAPANGRVRVRLNAYCWVEMWNSAQMGWGLRLGTTDVATAGFLMVRGQGYTGQGIATNSMMSVSLQVAGLPSGGPVTLKWSHASNQTTGLTYGNTFAGPGQNNYPPAIMEVWEAP